MKSEPCDENKYFIYLSKVSVKCDSQERNPVWTQVFINSPALTEEIAWLSCRFNTDMVKGTAYSSGIGKRIITIIYEPEESDRTLAFRPDLYMRRTKTFSNLNNFIKFGTCLLT